ncbi:MAG: 1-acyl-sn-glycerol-3-phosphate acyltransferase [Anaerolineaceae bacterium]|jgi:hypothetical protein|nr:1-acyl-sn-glycerol-3-phosphate acyltransferase [Anaerolineaceae bacterium]
MEDSRKESLRQIVLEDIKTSANLGKRKIVSWLIDRLGSGPAGWLAEYLSRIDEQLNETSLNETVTKAILALSDGLVLNNHEAVPTSGPLLVVANHPGLIDILGVIAILKREDVKIVAQQKGFMRVLRNINRLMLTLEPDSTFKLKTIREIIQALNDDMVVIIFPSGQLEPDPAIVPGAAEALQGWSDSIGVFLNKVPKTRLLPVLVSGILTEKAWNSRFAKFGPTQKRRHQFAMATQFVAQRFSKKPHWKRPLQIDIGQAKLPEVLDPNLDPRMLNQAVRQEMLDLLEKVYP